MPTCEACGTNVAGGKNFCTKCGAPMTAEPVAVPPVTRVTEPVFVPVEEPAPPPKKQPKGPDRGTHNGFAFSDPNAEPPSYSKYAVLTTADYLVMMLLMLIPVVNVILLLVWALGGSKKINRQNYARATLVMILVCAAIGVIASFFLSALVQGVWEQVAGILL